MLAQVSIVLRGEREAAVDRVKLVSSNLATITQERDAMAGELGSLRQASTSQLDEISEYREAIAELSERVHEKQNEADKDLFNEVAQSRDLRATLQAKESDLEDWKQRHRASSHELDTTRADCEGMLKVSRAKGSWVCCTQAHKCVKGYADAHTHTQHDDIDPSGDERNGKANLRFRFQGRS